MIYIKYPIYNFIGNTKPYYTALYISSFSIFFSWVVIEKFQLFVKCDIFIEKSIWHKLKDKLIQKLSIYN